MAFDKAALGSRYTCYECELKFYDLNKDPICPGCGADQNENPNMDAREAFLASLSTRGRKKATKAVEEPEAEETLDIDPVEDDEDEEDLGLSADDLLTGEAEAEPEED